MQQTKPHYTHTTLFIPQEIKTGGFNCIILILINQLFQKRNFKLLFSVVNQEKKQKNQGQGNSFHKKHKIMFPWRPWLPFLSLFTDHLNSDGGQMHKTHWEPPSHATHVCANGMHVMTWPCALFTCPGLKNSLVLPSRYFSGSYSDRHKGKCVT